MLFTGSGVGTGGEASVEAELDAVWLNVVVGMAGCSATVMACSSLASTAVRAPTHVLQVVKAGLLLSPLKGRSKTFREDN